MCSYRIIGSFSESWEITMKRLLIVAAVLLCTAYALEGESGISSHCLCTIPAGVYKTQPVSPPQHTLLSSVARPST